MWGLILGLLIAIVIAGFASLNSAPVSVSFLFWQAPEVPLALVALFSVFLGVIMAALFGTPQYIKTIKARRGLEKKIKELETRISALGTISTIKQVGETKNEETKSEDKPQN